jgi:uncharacterized damage-inducible protein DinB
MDLNDLNALLDYHYWARDRILDAAAALSPEALTKDLGSSFASVRDTLTHTYSAEWVWYSRWQGTSPTAALPMDLFETVEALRTAWGGLERQVRQIVSTFGEAGLDRVVEYRLISGQPGASAFWHMVQHVVNHASYHRGQVTTMLRQLGAAPPKSMDLIAFYREAART